MRTNAVLFNNRLNSQVFEKKQPSRMPRIKKLHNRPINSQIDHQAVDTFINHKSPMGMIKEIFLRIKAYRRIQAREAQLQKGTQLAIA